MTEQLTKKQRREQRKQEKEAAHVARQQKITRAKAIKFSIAIGIPVIVIGGFFLYWSTAPDASEIANTGAPDPTIGPDDAPITVHYYGDFQCPACAAADSEIIEAVKGRDDVRFIHNDFPLTLIHPRAKDAALIGECAFQLSGNDVFWKINQAFYEQQAEWSSSDGKEVLVEIAIEQGANEQELLDCLEQDQALPAVVGDVQAGDDLRVQGTPTFFVNDERYVGGRTSEDWNELFDSLVEEDA